MTLRYLVRDKVRRRGLRFGLVSCFVAVGEEGVTASK